MRTIPEMVTGLRFLAGFCMSPNQALLNDAANYIEGATENLRQQAEQLTAMRVRLDEVRPLMEEAAKELEEIYDIQRAYQPSYESDMKLPRSIRTMLRWWEPGATEPASISHWGVIK
jgi:DNA repair ATPase RecN